MQLCRRNHDAAVSGAQIHHMIGRARSRQREHSLDDVFGSRDEWRADFRILRMRGERDKQRRPEGWDDVQGGSRAAIVRRTFSCDQSSSPT